MQIKKLSFAKQNFNSDFDIILKYYIHAHFINPIDQETLFLNGNTKPSRNSKYQWKV